MNYLTNLAAMSIGRVPLVEPNFNRVNTSNGALESIIDSNSAQADFKLNNGSKEKNKSAAEGLQENSFQKNEYDLKKSKSIETEKNELASKDLIENTIAETKTYERDINPTTKVEEESSSDTNVIKAGNISIEQNTDLFGDSPLNFNQEDETILKIKKEKIPGRESVFNFTDNKNRFTKEAKIFKQNNIPSVISDGENKSAEPSTIKISIGRIEVKAVHPEKKTINNSGQKPQLSLSDYLKSFNRDKR